MTGVNPNRTSAGAGPRSPVLDCAAAFQNIALDAARVRAHPAGAYAGDPEAVHQIRVAMTRLRTAVTFFAAVRLMRGGGA